MFTDITEIHFAGGDTVEIVWVDGDENVESRWTNTVAHPEDIAFLNFEDEEWDDYIARMHAEEEERALGIWWD